MPPEKDRACPRWRRLVAVTAKRLVAAVILGALLWAPLLVVSPAALFTDRILLLFILLGTQVGCLLTGLAVQRDAVARGSYPFALLMGLVGAVLAVLLGLAYDELLRLWPGAGVPTIGPWGAVRALAPQGAAGLVLAGMFISPIADELFFRHGIFRFWADAGAPWPGAFVSSVLFALSRFDFVNFPAYVGLGLLLCGVYRCSGSLLAPWTTTTLLNLSMFLLLFSGYQ